MINICVFTFYNLFFNKIIATLYPLYMNKACKTTDPLERFKLVIAATIASNYWTSTFTKPVL
jgi:hypothetical protein